MIVELPLWLVIVQSVLNVLVFIHLAFSDLFAKILYKKIKDEEKNKNE